MKRWMIKKVGTFVLTAAAGVGVMSSGSAQGQDPNSPESEIQRRLGQLYQREGKQISAAGANSSQAHTQSTSHYGLRLAQPTNPAAHLKPIAPANRTGIQAPVTGQHPKLSSAPVDHLRTIQLTSGQQPATDPAPPVPAIRPNPFQRAAAIANSPMPVIAPRHAIPQAAAHPIASPETANTPALPIADHPLVEQVAEKEEDFEFPVLLESTPEAKVPLTQTPTFEVPEEADANAENPFAKAEEESNANSGVEIAPASEKAGKASVSVAAEPAVPLELGLDGCCPVMLRDGRQVVKGQTQHTSQWQGVAYQFSSPQAKQWFDANPAQYAPVKAGHDVTLAANTEAVGSLNHAVWYQRRLYLFQNEANQQAFSQNPAKYAK